MGYPIKHLPFKPDTGANQLVSVTSVSQSVSIDAEAKTLRLVNQGSVICYVRLGFDSATATPADIPVYQGKSIVIEKGYQNKLAYISSSTTVLNIQTGSGSNSVSVTENTVLALSPVLWLDASDVASVVLGTGVLQWKDKSGNGNNANQAVGASQPAYTSGDKLTFDGNNDFLNLGQDSSLELIPGTDSMSIFLVHKRDGVISGRWVITKAGTTDASRQWGFAESGGYAMRVGGSGSSFGTYPETKTVSSIIIGTSSGDFYQDGVDVGNISVGSSTNSLDWYLGARTDADTADGSAAFHFRGDIHEVIIYPYALSTPQRQAVETYLTGKWI